MNGFCRLIFTSVPSQHQHPSLGGKPDFQSKHQKLRSRRGEGGVLVWQSTTSSGPLWASASPSVRERCPRTGPPASRADDLQGPQDLSRSQGPMFRFRFCCPRLKVHTSFIFELGFSSCCCFKCIYFERQREREHGGRERRREREQIPSRLHTDRTPCGAQTHKPGDRDLS